MVKKMGMLRDNLMVLLKEVLRALRWVSKSERQLVKWTERCLDRKKVWAKVMWSGEMRVTLKEIVMADWWVAMMELMMESA